LRINTLNQNMLKIHAFRVSKPRGLVILAKERNNPIREFYLSEATFFERQRLCRTYDLLKGNNWCGFFSLANHTLKIRSKSLWMEKIMDKKMIPREPPGILLAQLYISQNERGNDYGAEALWHVIQMSLRSPSGCRLLIVDALGKKEKSFYEKHGWLSAQGTTNKMYFDLYRYEKTQRVIKRLYPNATPKEQLQFYATFEKKKLQQQSLF